MHGCVSIWWRGTPKVVSADVSAVWRPVEARVVARAEHSPAHRLAALHRRPPPKPCRSTSPTSRGSASCTQKRRMKASVRLSSRSSGDSPARRNARGQTPTSIQLPDVRRGGTKLRSMSHASRIHRDFAGGRPCRMIDAHGRCRHEARERPPTRPRDGDPARVERPAGGVLSSGGDAGPHDVPRCQRRRIQP